MLAWIAAQPWCDGNVGMIGISFAGGMSIVAAGRPSVRERAAFVLLNEAGLAVVGGQGDDVGFALLFPAPRVLAPSLWVRVSEFGWTPARYFALVLGLWTAAVMVMGGAAAIPLFR